MAPPEVTAPAARPDRGGAAPAPADDGLPPDWQERDACGSYLVFCEEMRRRLQRARGDAAW